MVQPDIFFCCFLKSKANDFRCFQSEMMQESNLSKFKSEVQGSQVRTLVFVFNFFVDLEYEDREAISLNIINH